jgi:hypothetical protein
MPAVSKAQQRFFGVVKGIQKGDAKGTGKAKKAAKDMSKKDVDDFAKTKHKGLPNRVKKKERVKELIKKMVREIMSEINEATKRDYKAEYKKYGSSTKAKKYRAELNKYNRQKGTYGNGDKKDASHKGGKIVGFEEQSKNRGRAEKSRLKKEGKLNEKFDLKKLEDAIKMFQKKIKKQGRVTNARDEQHLKQLIKVYKDMGGRKIKEEKLKESFQKRHFLNLIKQEIESLKGQIAYAKDKVRYKGTPDWEKKEFAAILKDKIKDLKDTEKHYKRVEKLKEGKLTEGKGVDKVLSMANNNSFGKLGGKTVDAMSANLFKTVYDKLTGSNKEKIDKMNEKQLYVFMTKLWTKFGKQVRI